MKKQIYYELKKLLHNYRFTGCVLFLWGIGIFSLFAEIYIPSEDGYSLKEVSAFYDSISDMNAEEQIQYLEDEIEYSLKIWIQRIINSGNPGDKSGFYISNESISELEETGTAGSDLTDLEKLSEEKLWSKRMMLQQIYDQLLETRSYPEYLQEIKTQADKDIPAFLLGENGIFYKENAYKTARAYEKLTGSEARVCFLDAVGRMLDGYLFGIPLFLSVLILSLRCFHIDEIDGRVFLLRTTIKGRRYLGLVKWLAVMITNTLILVVYIIAGLCIVLPVTPFANFGVPVQSIPGYMKSPFALTVYQYILLYLICKWFTIIAVSSLVFLFSSVCKKMIYTGLSVLIAGLIEYGLWIWIDNQSIYLFWKQFNIFSVINTSQYFSSYLNLNLWNKPVNSLIVGALFIVLAAGFSFIYGNYKYATRKISSGGRGKIINLNVLKKDKQAVRGSVFFYETYKLFVIHKGFVFLLLLVVIQGAIFQRMYIYNGEEEYYYHMYSEQLAGDLSDEKAEYLQDEEKQMENRQEQLSRYYEMYERQEIAYGELLRYEGILEISESRKSAFMRAKEQYETLETIRERGYDVDYVYLTGWNWLLGSGAARMILMNFVKMLLTLAFPLWSYQKYEKENRTLALIHSSLHYSKFRIARAAAAGLLACIDAVLSIVPFVVFIFYKYGFQGWNAPFNSLVTGNLLKYPASIGFCFLAVQFAQLLCAVFGAICYVKCE